MKEIFEGKTILITGGTGFLGRNLIRRILEYNPQSIRVFSRDEVKHYRLAEMFKKDTRLRSLIGDVRDYSRIKRATEGVDVVIHAAALKRIDILEYNVEESIKTNIIGSLNLVNACLQNNVSKVIMVSTDKACLPVNTYGACKFVSERIFVESNYSKGKSDTVFCCVRYGNVMESTGSVIPFFLEKIRRNEPIPITDEEMTRFIITQDEAVDLIFTAIKYGKGGEVFVPDLPSFKITMLAEALTDIENKKVPNRIIGIRPGEKIHELMINEAESHRSYKFENNTYVITSQIQKYKADSQPDYLDEQKKVNFKELSSADRLCDKESLKKILKDNSLLM